MIEHGTIWDNGGETFDRYTVEFVVGKSDGDYEEVYYLAIGDTGNVPNGVCMHVDGVQPGDHLGAEITLEQMTDAARRAVLAEERFASRLYADELARREEQSP